MHAVRITEETQIDLDEYALISSAFEVCATLDLATLGNDPQNVDLSRLQEVKPPYTKDYDAIQGNTPADWASRFDLSKWGFFAARIDGKRIGGAAVACEHDGLCTSNSGPGVAMLWDIRVIPSFRDQEVGAALFQRVEKWAFAQGCRQLKIETQHNNVPACQFYSSQGCDLESIEVNAYPDLPEEVRLLWYKRLMT